MLTTSNPRPFDHHPYPGHRAACTSILWAIAAVLPVAGFPIFTAWKADADRLAAIAAQEVAYETLVAQPPLDILPLDPAIRGRDLFTTTCIACHGTQGLGVAGLGKDLVHSDFVAMQSDADLVKFLSTGRPAAKPLPMPPKGGRDDMTTADLQALALYLRGLQDPRRMPDLPAPVADAAREEAVHQAALAASGGDAELAEYIASGNKLFHASCAACHGPAGAGIAGNGKTLANNTFIQSLDDDGLLAFIKQGRAPTDPASTTGIQMPPKGGNPAMSEDDILDVIAYLRTLQPGDPAHTQGPAVPAPGAQAASK